MAAVCQYHFAKKKLPAFESSSVSISLRYRQCVTVELPAPLLLPCGLRETYLQTIYDMAKTVRKAITCVYQSSLTPEFDLDFLLRDYFTMTHPVLGVENIRQNTFHKTALFVLVGDTPLKGLHEFKALRKRFAKRKFVFIWCGLRHYLEAAASIGVQPIYVDNIRNPNIEAITALIEEALEAEVYQVDKRAKPMLASELADRIDAAANAVADLRINSVGHVVDELRSISKSFRGELVSDLPSADVIQDARDPLKNVLISIAQIFDIIDSSRTASMIVAGCVTALVGGVGGWSSALCFNLALASWHGKEAFIATVNRLGPLKKTAS